VFGDERGGEGRRDQGLRGRGEAGMFKTHSIDDRQTTFSIFCNIAFLLIVILLPFITVILLDKQA
jgi:hypothetical protein